jgi:polyisoprenyl-teichoic acid--peptidoglycan teichoic acid transferase
MPPPLDGGRSVYAAKRSRGRTLALATAAVVAVAAVVVVALSALGGSSSPKHAGSTATTTASRTATTHANHSSHRAAKAAPKAPTVSPAETTVAVLNATEAEGLAHRTASALQQNGYSQAEALSGKPPGSGQVSVVEYTSGHEAEAEGVARSASITHVLPIEAAVSALAGSANVVVIVGADKEHETSNQ